MDHTEATTKSWQWLVARGRLCSCDFPAEQKKEMHTKTDSSGYPAGYLTWNEVVRVWGGEDSLFKTKNPRTGHAMGGHLGELRTKKRLCCLAVIFLITDQRTPGPANPEQATQVGAATLRAVPTLRAAPTLVAETAGEGGGGRTTGSSS